MAAIRIAHLFTPALAAAALALAACSDNGGASAASGASVNPYLEDIVMGDTNAPVEIVEYASLSCPHCRDFWKQEFPRIRTNYIDTGKVRYTLKDFPTAPAELAIAATAIARCAGKDGYYDVVDDVFTHYHDLMDAVRSSSGALPVLVAVGDRAGLSPDEVRACIQHPGIQTYIDGVVTEAQARGVNSTPTIFINGEKMLDHDYATLAAKIDGIIDPDAVAAPAEPPVEDATARDASE